jgi:hypothetical protein
VVLALAAIAIGIALIVFAFTGRQSKARRENNWRQNP